MDIRKIIGNLTTPPEDNKIIDLAHEVLLGYVAGLSKTWLKHKGEK